MGIPQILILISAAFGVALIVKGSALYSHQEITAHLKAAKYILLGNILMTCTAFLAWNPLFALPELLTVLTALRSYGAQKSFVVDDFSRKMHLSSLLILLALGVGLWVVWSYANSFAEATPALGLTLLACAFAMTPSEKTQKLYRMLTILGSGFLVCGSALTAKNAANAEALIMSLAFLGLNTWFLLAEFWTVLRLKK